MAANSTVLINSTSHDNTAHDTPLVGEKFKGAGFYGLGDGFHTVQLQLSTFTGTVKIQGTLAADPTEEDWMDIGLESQAGVVFAQGTFTVDTSGAIVSSVPTTDTTFTNQTVNKVYNFVGNFVWVRAAVTSFTAGTINRVLYN